VPPRNFGAIRPGVGPTRAAHIGQRLRFQIGQQRTAEAERPGAAPGTRGGVHVFGHRAMLRKQLARAVQRFINARAGALG
jgi:hypothetical protein